MQLTDVQVDQYGVMAEFALQKLSPQITVFWGPNGCGKSTLVRFLRGMLFGFQSPERRGGSNELGEAGAIRFRTSTADRLMKRSRSPVGHESFRVIDPWNQQPVGRQDNHLPAWVTDEVFREVFSVGWDEADRFELLTQLSLESGIAASPLAAEIRSAELAMQQAIRERDGDHPDRGILHRITELRRQQQDLTVELNTLRRPAVDVSERVSQLIREIERLTAEISRIDVELADLDRKISQLENQLRELRSRHRLPLNRPQIEAQISQLSGQLERWQSIRDTIAREVTPGRSGQSEVVDSTDRQNDRVALTTQITATAQCSLPADCLISVRAIVSRLEDRVQALTAGRTEIQRTDAERNADTAVLRQLKLETAALCNYLAQHEASVELRDDELMQLFAHQSLHNVGQLESVLQARLNALRRESARADDVLANGSLPRTVEVSATAGCHHRLHAEINSVADYDGFNTGTIQEMERELVRLQASRTKLVAERGGHEETRHARRAVLEHQQQELAAAATLEQIDGLRARIAELDAKAVLLEDRRRQLDHSELSLREMIDRLKQRCQPRVLEVASGFLCRLTEGECTQITVTAAPASQLLFQTFHQTEPLTIEQLSRGTRHQAALALRMALIQVRAESSERAPLILDDVFITSDDSRASAVVRLLMEIADQGQQIVFFTCQKDVRDLFLKFHADVRTFDGEPLSIETMPTLKAYVEEPVVVQPVEATDVSTEPVLPPTPIKPVEQPVEQVPETVVATMTSTANWLFYLEVDHDVDELAGISLGELQAFRAAGVRTIDDLLSHSCQQLEELARARGYLLSPERLQALQGQAELTCRVPMLRRSDAALLYAAGIRTAEELSLMRPETVYDRVISFQRTEPGSRYRRAGRLIDRQQAINWARWGQHSRSLQDARLTRSRFSTRSSVFVPVVPGISHDSQRTQRRERIRQTGSLTRRRPLVAEATDEAQRRARRLARRRRQAERTRSVSRQRAPLPARELPGFSAAVNHPVASQSHGAKELRFFLSRHSDIEAAPSIGPRTAESLRELGIRTVDELLSIGPERLAQQLNQRRITASVIQLWQAQARLMCQVPELRGHDVQLLVACGISDPENLIGRNPAELLALVAPFAESKEGERILRNGPRPDIDEVRNWIRWASSARSFRAAS